MHEILITGNGVTLRSGIVSLSHEQAVARAGCLSDLSDGLYQIEKPVQFKRGERLGYDGEVNKALAELIVADESPKPAAPVKKAKR